MTATVQQFHDLLNQMGSNVLYHREVGGAICPCVSPEGFRSPAWHKAHPSEPVCDEAGRLSATVIEATVKAAVQPLRGFRIPERLVDLLGEVQTDDQVGVFPVTWGSLTLDFYSWDDSGRDYVLHDNRRYIVVNADKLPDIDGDPNHHWECGLRLIKTPRPI